MKNNFGGWTAYVHGLLEYGGMMNLEISFWRSFRAAMVDTVARAEGLGWKILLPGFLSFDEVIMCEEIGGQVAGGGSYRHLAAVLFYFRMANFEFRVESSGDDGMEILSVVCGFLSLMEKRGQSE